MNYSVRPYVSGEEKFVADAHKRAYSEEYHWGDSFIRYATKVAEDFASSKKSDREELWVAETEGKPIGYIMLCQAEEPLTGQLRLFLVEKEYRHYGVGVALIAALMEKAKKAGYKELILWTASPLTDAIRQYGKLGFHCVEKVENHDWSLDGETLFEIKMQMSMN